MLMPNDPEIMQSIAVLIKNVMLEDNPINNKSKITPRDELLGNAKKTLGDQMFESYAHQRKKELQNDDSTWDNLDSFIEKSDIYDDKLHDDFKSKNEPPKDLQIEVITIFDGSNSTDQRDYLEIKQLKGSFINGLNTALPIRYNIQKYKKLNTIMSKNAIGLDEMMLTEIDVDIDTVKDPLLTCCGDDMNDGKVAFLGGKKITNNEIKLIYFNMGMKKYYTDRTTILAQLISLDSQIDHSSGAGLIYNPIYIGEITISGLQTTSLALNIILPNNTIAVIMENHLYDNFVMLNAPLLITESKVVLVKLFSKFRKPIRYKKDIDLLKIGLFCKSVEFDDKILFDEDF